MQRTHRATHLYPATSIHAIGRIAATNAYLRAHAMIDVSDGLSTDLHHILEESKRLRAHYKNRIPAAEGTKTLKCCMAAKTTNF